MPKSLISQHQTSTTPSSKKDPEKSVIVHPFSELSYEEKIEFCKNRKTEIENNWKMFIQNKIDEKYSAAALNFIKAIELGDEKAYKLFESKSPDEVVPEDSIPCSDEPSESIEIALRYKLGLGLPKSDQCALTLSNKAAQRGDACAQFMLSHFYIYGVGADKNGKRAIELLEPAAEQGYAPAQYQLGFCYDGGIRTYILHPYFTSAHKWYNLAAEQGYAPAQAKLGVLYRKYWQGRDSTKVSTWLRLAAEQGNQFALNELKGFRSPLVRYIVCILEENFTDAFKIALANGAVQEQFFAQDFKIFAVHFSTQAKINDLIELVQEQVKKKNSNINAFITEVLLRLDKSIGTQEVEKNEMTASFMSELLYLIKIEDTPSHHLNDLMYFFCNNCNAENAKEILVVLDKLWHRACALDFIIDDTGLSRLIGSILIGQLFDYRYELSFNKSISPDQLKTLFYAYERSTPYTVELLNNALGEPLLVESAYVPNKILPQLKECLSSFTYKPSGPLYHISKLLLNFNEKTENGWESLSKLIRLKSAFMLEEQLCQRFFIKPKSLNKNERKLLLALKNEDFQAISEWILENKPSSKSVFKF